MSNSYNVQKAGGLVTAHAAAQYSQPLSIYYHNIDMSIDEIYLTAYLDQELSIKLKGSSFIDFACWRINNDVYYPNDIFYALGYSQLNIYMSCCEEFELTYDSNGGEGTMPSLTSYHHTYIGALPATDDLYNSDRYGFNEEYTQLVMDENNFSRDGYTFLNWTVNDKVYPPGRLITLYSDVTAYANWESSTKYSVRFYSDSVLISEQSVREGYDAVPPAITKAGYNTLNWDNAYTNVHSDLTCNAVWSGLVLYSITYNMNGCGITPTVNTYTVEDEYTPPTPSEQGYVFHGWTPASIQRGTTGNVKFTAHWVEEVIEKRFVNFSSSNSSFGTVSTESVYETIGTTVTSTASKTRADAIFNGWYNYANVLVCSTETITVTVDTDTSKNNYTAKFSLTIDTVTDDTVPTSFTMTYTDLSSYMGSLPWWYNKSSNTVNTLETWGSF